MKRLSAPPLRAPHMLHMCACVCQRTSAQRMLDTRTARATRGCARSSRRIQVEAYVRADARVRVRAHVRIRHHHHHHQHKHQEHLPRVSTNNPPADAFAHPPGGSSHLTPPADNIRRVVTNPTAATLVQPLPCVWPSSTERLALCLMDPRLRALQGGCRRCRVGGLLPLCFMNPGLRALQGGAA